MGVDFFSCHFCSESFPDCGDYVSCDCGNHWCSDECACKEGYDYEDRKTCSFCRQEEAEDHELLKFLMKEYKLTRKKLLEMYFNRKKKKRKKEVKPKLVSAADDPRWTLAEWKNFIEEQISKHGEEAVMFTDGGYNNVTLTIEVSKKYLRRKEKNDGTHFCVGPS